MLGIIHLKDVVKQGIRERFARFRAMGIRTVMITGDNPRTAKAIAAEAGVDDFLAEATPETKMKLIKAEQAKGKLVAMTGDGTNDAPALAQADVGVAMNTGTQAAKEAGNMVDLDSDPTKLLEVVEVGKQLLMTRGSLTTFSIANDVAKYFAILPAMFMGVFPQIAPLNVMHLASPLSAILAAVIFNAIIIIALDPARAARREVSAARRGGAAAAFARDLWRRRRDRAVRRDQADRSRARRVGGRMKTLVIALRATLVTLVVTGIIYPLVVTGLAQLLFPYRAGGSIVTVQGRRGRFRADRAGLHDPAYFHRGRRRATTTRRIRRARTWPSRRRSCATARSSGRELGVIARRTASARWRRDSCRCSVSLGQRHRSPYLARERAAASGPHREGARCRGGSRARDRRRVHRGPWLGVIGEPRVDVLMLDLALDRTFGAPAHTARVTSR